MLHGSELVLHLSRRHSPPVDLLLLPKCNRPIPLVAIIIVHHLCTLYHRLSRHILPFLRDLGSLRLRLLSSYCQ